MLPRHEFCIFFKNDLELAKLYLSRNHDTPSGHKKSLCDVEVTLGRNPYTPLSDKHSLCEVTLTSNISP